MLVIPDASWFPVTPGVTSTTSNRSPDLYMSVIRQFPVETHIRWKPGHTAPGATYCNIFLSDCTLALGCGVPHVVDDNGNPVALGKGSELNANATCDWLLQHGPRFGWRFTGLGGALSYVQAGKPAICTWKNPRASQPGHVAILLPTQPGPKIAQAGARNFVGEPLANGFGNLPVSMFIHE